MPCWPLSKNARWGGLSAAIAVPMEMSGAPWLDERRDGGGRRASVCRLEKHLKQVEGLGTSATRAPRISKIIPNEFVIETKLGKLTSDVPTPKAEVDIKCVPPKFALLDRTSHFEGLLDNVKEGALSYPDFGAKLQLPVHKTVLNGALDGSTPAVMPAPEQMAE